MLPIILALAGGYLIVDSQKEKLKFEDGGKMAKGGIYSSDEPYIIDIIVDDKVVKSQTIRARNQKEANEIALDDEYEVTRKYGDHETKVYLAPPKMADGGEMMAKGGELPSSFKKKLDNAKKTYGVTITKEQAEKAFKMHNDKGMGGSTVGYELFNAKSKRGSQTLGDLAIDLGRHYSK